jgi:hypothetical protein
MLDSQIVLAQIRAQVESCLKEADGVRCRPELRALRIPFPRIPFPRIPFPYPIFYLPIETVWSGTVLFGAVPGTEAA